MLELKIIDGHMEIWFEGKKLPNISKICLTAMNGNRMNAEVTFIGLGLEITKVK